MSVTQRVKQGFLRLPILEKALLFGSFLVMVSPLLPWYDNRNAFGVGESYLGIQGPMFAIGGILILLGGFSFLKMVFPLVGKNFFMKRKNGGVALTVGIQSLLLIMVSNSIFFHPAFGTNITHKATRFGMIAAFVGVGTLIIAGYFCWKKQKDMTPEEVMESMKAEPVEPTISSYQDSEPVPVQDTSFSTPRRVEPATPVNEEIPARPNSPYSRPEGAYGGDPLTLDAKTRYKMMKSKQRSESNLWQQNSSEPTVTDSMKIRTDL